MILIIYAHPYPEKSTVNKLMLKLAANNTDVVIRSLYDLYPDFNINVEAEQKTVEQADLLVLQPLKARCPSGAGLWSNLG